MRGSYDSGLFVQQNHRSSSPHAGGVAMVAGVAAPRGLWRQWWLPPKSAHMDDVGVAPPNPPSGGCVPK